MTANGWICDSCGAIEKGDLCLSCGRSRPIDTPSFSGVAYWGTWFYGQPSTRIAMSASIFYAVTAALALMFAVVDIQSNWFLATIFGLLAWPGIRYTGWWALGRSRQLLRNR